MSHEAPDKDAIAIIARRKKLLAAALTLAASCVVHQETQDTKSQLDAIEADAKSESAPTSIASQPIQPETRPTTAPTKPEPPKTICLSPKPPKPPCLSKRPPKK